MKMDAKNRDDLTVLIVDDVMDNLALLHDALNETGYTVLVANDGQSALKTVKKLPPDLILLDAIMPEMDGFEVLRQLRQSHKTPVIMLTAKGDDFDRVLGLELGADDYLPKPFNHRELSARVKALLRRSEFSSQTHSAQVLSIGSLQLDTAKQRATVEEQELEFTSTEFLLLKLLMLSVGELVTKAAISEQILGRRLAAFDRSIDMHVSNIRKKLAMVGLADPIKTVRGAGYIFRSAN